MPIFIVEQCIYILFAHSLIIPLKQISKNKIAGLKTYAQPTNLFHRKPVLILIIPGVYESGLVTYISWFHRLKTCCFIALIYISLFSDMKRRFINLLIFYIYFLYYELPDHILCSSINLWYYYSKKKAKTKNFVSNVSNSILRYLSFHCLNCFLYTQLFKSIDCFALHNFGVVGAVERLMFRKTFLHPRLYLLSIFSSISLYIWNLF